MTKWGEKPYHSLDYMLRERFGEKVYKVTLNGGMSCPNRDGKIGTRGCIFCSAGGSGDFAADAALSITDQIESQISILSQKRPIHKYIAYFQAYTNTYAPVEYLEKIFTEAISHPKIVALSIGTRPDCLSPEIVTLLSRLNKQKPVWIELGLQTIHESTARYIRRGYPLCVFDDAVKRLRKENIEVKPVVKAKEESISKVEKVEKVETVEQANPVAALVKAINRLTREVNSLKRLVAGKKRINY